MKDLVGLISLGILAFALGLLAGYLLWRSEPVDPGPGETVVVERDEEGRLDADEATAPGIVTVYRERVDTVDVCLGLPPALVRDTLYLPRPGAERHAWLPYSPVLEARTYPFLILPFAADGDPAVSIYAHRTEIITYDPETARRIDLTYAHPQTRWRLAPLELSAGYVLPRAGYAHGMMALERGPLTIAAGYALTWHGDELAHGPALGLRWTPIRWEW